MTECKSSRLDLKRLKGRRVDVDFEGGTLTSDGGLLLLREADRRLDLLRRAAEMIPDPRSPDYVLHSQEELLTSRVLGIAAGYEDGNDHQQLRHDPAFQVAAGHTPAEGNYDEDRYPLASPATHSRFENRIDAKTNLRLHELFVDVFLESFVEAPEEIILDYDATDDTTYGLQQRRYFNGFYDSYCFLPLYVFCGDQLLVSYLRPSSVGAAHHARAVTKLLVQKIRSRWPEVKIILRGDSGFCISRLMDWCDRNDVHYVFGLQKNAVLNGKLACSMTLAKIRYGVTGQKQSRFCWFRYSTQRSWNRYRWVLGKAEFGDDGENPRYVVTNLPSDQDVVDDEMYWTRVNGKPAIGTRKTGNQCWPIEDPEQFYRTMYCQRGEMENRIKEQQLCLFADRTSCTKFQANQFRLILSSLAYLLLDGIRRLALTGTDQARLRVDTIRLKLIKIAARVRVSCRRVLFQLASHCPNADLFRHVLVQLCRSG
ncbi:MAG: IS1380 family transposase [Planctomycetota bacterium]